MRDIDGAIALAFELFQKQLRDSEMVERLGAAGYCPEVIDKVLGFFPLACGRVTLEEIGVSSPANYRPTYADGTVGDPRPLNKDPVWRAIERFIALPARAANVRLIGMQSAEFDATNQAMLNGGKPEDLVGSDPILFFSVTPPNLGSPRPWWRFWS